MNDVTGAEKSTNGRKQPTAKDLAALRLLRETFALSSRVSPRLTASAALSLFLRPTRHRRPDREREALKTAVPLFMGERAGEVAAWQWGWRGPTVLLVHGWEGRGAQLGGFVAPLLEAGFRVVTFDAPAHGESPGSSATLIDFADTIERVAGWVGPLAGIVAHSFGAAGATLAMARGLRVPTAAFIAPPARLEDGARAFADALALPTEIRAEMRRQLEARVGYSWDELDVGKLARDQRAELLVVHDREDREIPWSKGEELASVWPSARLLSTSGLGHRRILRDPAVIAEVVAALRDRSPAYVPSDLDREIDAMLH